MNYKRAVLISVAAYLTSFALGLLTISVAGVIPALPYIFMVIQFLSIIGIGILFTWWYFRSPHEKPSATIGFRFGVVAVIVGFVLDLLVFIPAYLSGTPLSDIAAAYSNPLFWITVALFLLSTTTTAAVLAQRSLDTPITQ